MFAWVDTKSGLVSYDKVVEFFKGLFTCFSSILVLLSSKSSLSHKDEKDSGV